MNLIAKLLNSIISKNMDNPQDHPHPTLERVTSCVASGDAEETTECLAAARAIEQQFYADAGINIKAFRQGRLMSDHARKEVERPVRRLASGVVQPWKREAKPLKDFGWERKDIAIHDTEIRIMYSSIRRDINGGIVQPVSTKSRPLFTPFDLAIACVMPWYVTQIYAITEGNGGPGLLVREIFDGLETLTRLCTLP